MSVVCKTCGAPVERIGNYYVCEYCRHKWEIDSGNDVHAVDRANAWSALRDGDFEKATALFEEIIVKENQNHEAYWGRALALGGIVYVTDLSENKKVPTCNNITEESFVNSKDVQKAISLAPADIAESYRKQADYIEKVRVEWLEKASKEPAYDVFISFKDSDREHGIERTQDSIDAQDLYNALVADGYKVFFSRISLRDKISEQYEPYIYNAIKTAKVMIVFGEKPEYFNAVWLKNEWMRFKSRIEKGEKHKNSLVVVYKSMNPGDLPAVLRSRQCLNAADMTFLSDLTRHIKRVVEESKRNVHLEKIEITGGQIAKKATSIAVNSVKTREIGAGAIAETSISEQQTLSLAKTYLEASQWDEAAQLVGDVLFENPGCAEAIWYGLLAKYHAEDDSKLQKKFDDFQQEDFATIDKYLNCSSKNTAKEKLTWLWKSLTSMRDGTCCAMLNIILPYSFQTRGLAINRTFEHVIQTSKFESFCLLMRTLKPSDVDKYIDYNYRYATMSENMERKAECLRNVLKVEEGNVAALREMVFTDLARNLPTEEIVNDFEHLLKYTTSIDEEVCSCLEWLKQYASYKEHGAFTRQVLRYFTGELSTLRDLIRDVSYQLLKIRATQDVDYLLTVLLKLNPNDADAYWEACLMKLGVSSEDEIVKSRVPLQNIPEFNKYLSLVDAARRKACLQLLDTQKYNIHREKCALAQILICDGKHFLNIHTLHIFGTDEHRLSQLRIKRQWKTRKWGMHMVQTVDDTLWFENKSDKAYYPIEKVYPLKIVNPADVTDALAFSAVNGDYGSDSIDSRAYILILAKKDGTTQKISHHIDRFSRIELKDFERCLSDYSVKNGKFLYHGVCASILENGAVQTLKKSYSSEYYSLRDDGTVAEKDYSNGTVYTRNCDEIKQAVQLFEMSYLCCAVLLADGTVTAVRKNETSVCENESLESEKWYQEITKLQNIVAVSEHGDYFLKKDGSIIKINYKTDGLEVTPIEGKCFGNFDTILEDYEASVRKYQQEEQERETKSEKTETMPEIESKDSGVSKSKQGCYVATCVYGSYDCPQVWTLRRFRDNVLAKTWYGRAFIRTYYAVSPTLVKWFGHTTWFKKLWKGKLDRMVQKLNEQGVNNTPYND